MRIAFSSSLMLRITLLMAVSWMETSFAEMTLPSPAIRTEMLTKAVTEMNRVDGEGLIPRGNRPQSWERTTALLSEEASQAGDLFALGRVFRRLDATYPNLHARVYLAAALDERKSAGGVRLPLRFAPASVERGRASNLFFVAEVFSDEAKRIVRPGDRVLKINDLPVEQWSDENFIFCKFPLREQCDVEFFNNLEAELLSWNRHQPLTLTLARGSREYSFPVSIKFEPHEEKSRKWKENPAEPCGVNKERYPGFAVKYHGHHLCAFEAKAAPGTVVLRIRSFVYDEPSPFSNLPGEVDIFWRNYWRQRAGSVKTLILDVIGNFGGEAPIPYYTLLFPKPFQEQFVQFKKIAEFERRDILQSLFWGDRGKEIWFKNIKNDGSFAATPTGDFLGTIPQFCARPDQDCRDGLFETRPNGFHGQVKILIDHWCISSCVGFVWNLADVLGSKVKTYGLPDSADSAYSRLTVTLTPEANGVVAGIAALQKARTPDSPEPWVRQVTAVTRSTDRTGRVLAGIPQRIDEWVPRRWSQSESAWASQVFQSALKDRKPSNR